METVLPEDVLDALGITLGWISQSPADDNSKTKSVSTRISLRAMGANSIQGVLAGGAWSVKYACRNG